MAPHRSGLEANANPAACRGEARRRPGVAPVRAQAMGVDRPGDRRGDGEGRREGQHDEVADAVVAAIAGAHEAADHEPADADGSE